MTGKDVKNDSLAGTDVSEGSLDCAKISGCGTAGPQGPAGRSALAPLQSGETVRGVIGVRDNLGATTGSVVGFASLPIPASVPLTNADVEVDLGNDSTGRCTGTAANPTAPPGVACIYQQGITAGNTNTRGLESAGGPVRWGFRVAIDPTTPNTSVFFEGTWAYTAP